MTSKSYRFFLSSQKTHVKTTLKNMGDEIQLYTNISQGGDYWFWLRKQWRITSTKVATIMGVDPNLTRIKYWRICKGLAIHEFGDFAQQAMAHGQAHEEEAFEAARKLVKDEGDWHYSPGPYVWSYDTTVAASPDAVLVRDGKVAHCIEIKCPYVGSWWDVDNGLELFVDGKRAKPNYYIQMQFQMACADCETCLFFIYLCGDTDKEPEWNAWLVERDDAFIDFCYAKINYWFRTILPADGPGLARVGKKERAETKERLRRSVRAKVAPFRRTQPRFRFPPHLTPPPSRHHQNRLQSPIHVQ